MDIDITDDIKAWVNSSATFYDSHSAKGNYWEAASTWRPNFPQNAAPLISTDMIAPNAKAAWDLMSVAKLVDGKYFLAGTQANSSNVLLISILQEVVNLLVVNSSLIRVSISTCTRC